MKAGAPAPTRTAARARKHVERGTARPPARSDQRRAGNLPLVYGSFGVTDRPIGATQRGLTAAAPSASRQSVVLRVAHALGQVAQAGGRDSALRTVLGQRALLLPQASQATSQRMSALRCRGGRARDGLRDARDEGFERVRLRCA